MYVCCDDDDVCFLTHLSLRVFVCTCGVVPRCDGIPVPVPPWIRGCGMTDGQLAGNGGDTGVYRWTQTLEDVTVVYLVPEGTRGRDLDVRITEKSLQFGFKGKEPIFTVREPLPSSPQHPGPSPGRFMHALLKRPQERHHEG